MLTLMPDVCLPGTVADAQGSSGPDWNRADTGTTRFACRAVGAAQSAGRGRAAAELATAALARGHTAAGPAQCGACERAGADGCAGRGAEFEAGMARWSAYRAVARRWVATGLAAGGNLARGAGGSVALGTA